MESSGPGQFMLIPHRPSSGYCNITFSHHLLTPSGRGGSPLASPQSAKLWCTSFDLILFVAVRCDRGVTGLSRPPPATLHYSPSTPPSSEGHKWQNSCGEEEGGSPGAGTGLISQCLVSGRCATDTRDQISYICFKSGPYNKLDEIPMCSINSFVFCRGMTWPGLNFHL